MTTTDQKRRIALTISPATATHCGTSLSEKCQRLKLGQEYMHCIALGAVFEYHGDDPPERLPECIAAELP